MQPAMPRIPDYTLEYEQTDESHLGILKEPVSAGGGAGGMNYDIIPGDAHSILLTA